MRSARFPGKRFSFLRLGIFLAVVIIGGCATYIGINFQLENRKPTAEPWFGSYIDVTATPSYAFESQSSDSQGNVLLAFVVSRSSDDCAPTWGGAYSLAEANQALDLERRIAQVQRSGRSAVISFGGQAGVELAQSCQTVGDLADAYSQVISRYNVSTIDVDIEGDSLADSESMLRRAQAIAQLQSASGTDTLNVWLTLPADQNGLTNDGVAAVQTFLDQGVAISGVNLMTMDFGVQSSDTAVAALVEDALSAGHSQLFRLFAANITFHSSHQIWAMMGATVMIGQSDVAGESFTLADAGTISTFALTNGLGRLSMWSANRDFECEANYSDWGSVADFCSGVSQEAGGFASVLSYDFTGSADDQIDGAQQVTPQTPNATEDDPATSPYPIWSAEESYAVGSKVVWHRNVYIALWGPNDGHQPDEVTSGTSAAWRLVGPVLKGETPEPEPTVSAGTYAQWDSSTAYGAGDRVMFDGVAFQAKWWTQGDSPTVQNDSDTSPWRELTTQEIQELTDN